MIFDENGNPVEEVIINPVAEETDTSLPLSESAIVCPMCGTLFVLGDDVISSKTKERMCPTCGTIVGEW